MSMGKHPLLQLAQAVRGRKDWAYRNQAAVHRSGVEVAIDGPYFYVVGDTRRFIMPDVALMQAERFDGD